MMGSMRPMETCVMRWKLIPRFLFFCSSLGNDPFPFGCGVRVHSFMKCNFVVFWIRLNPMSISYSKGRRASASISLFMGSWEGIPVRLNLQTTREGPISTLQRAFLNIQETFPVSCSFGRANGSLKNLNELLYGFLIKHKTKWTISHSGRIWFLWDWPWPLGSRFLIGGCEKRGGEWKGEMRWSAFVLSWLSEGDFDFCSSTFDGIRFRAFTKR